MPSYNYVHLAGHLARDPETRTVGESTVTSFCIAVSEKYTTKSGEKRENTAWVDCEAWGRKGEVIAQYHTKGSAILVTGKLRQDNWEDASTGAKRSKLKVVVGDFSFLPKGGDKAAAKEEPTQGGGSVSNSFADYSDNPPF